MQWKWRDKPYKELLVPKAFPYNIAVEENVFEGRTHFWLKIYEGSAIREDGEWWLRTRKSFESFEEVEKFVLEFLEELRSDIDEILGS